ncbi:uncharacterized protein LOC128794030 [Vidua chalybeata]|uniref:uncharacterized protein LOC128794030 n=1 Tax=Vidua chalybeata TaxID=81927 RepID=UPI0023A83803|nr:uncharacterized protein LOC128794030 [Vidua chalybeata]
MGVHSGGTANAMRSQQALGSQQAEVTAGSEVTEVPEPRGCTAPQGPSSQSLSTTVAAAAAVAAVVLTLGQWCQDSGGSKSCGTGRGRGTMALALRLFLPLLLAVALLARAAQAAPLQVRGADWDHDLDYLEVLMNDGLKFLEDVGAEPVAEGGAASQPIPSTDPLGDAEGVSAEWTFPGPLVEVAHKPSSHHKGPRTEKIKDTANKISLEPSELMWQMLREMLQAGQEMEGEAVQKEAFPRGSSDSVPASAAGREAMPGTVTGDEADGKASPLAWLNEVLKPLEPPAAVSAGRNFPAPLLIAPRKPGSLRRGPPRGKNKPRGEKELLESNNILKQIVKKLHKEHEMEGEAVQKEAFPRGSSDSVPASAAGREAMPGTVTGGNCCASGPEPC